MRRERVFAALFAVIVTIPITLRAESALTMKGVVRGGIAVPQASLISHSYEIRGGYSLPNVGYSIAGEVHIGIADVPLVVNLGSSMTSFSNTGVVLNPWRMGPAKQDYSISMHIVSVDLGLIYQPLEIGMLQPYLGANGKLSFFSGSLRNDGVPGSNPLEMNLATRFGIDLTAGTEVSFPGLPFAFDIQAKYTLANLVGKQFDETSSGYELSDGKRLSSTYDKARAISYTTVTLGLVFSIF